MTLTLNASPIFPLNTPAYNAVLSNQVWLQTNQQFGKYNKNSHILIKDLVVTFTLNTVNQFFCTTLWLMMLHNHTRFGNKIFCGSEDIFQTKHSLTFWTFTLTLTSNAVIPFFHWTLQLMMLYYQTKFGCKGTSSLENVVEIVIFFII